MLVRKGDVLEATKHVQLARDLLQTQEGGSAQKLMLSKCEYAEGLVHHKAGRKVEAMLVILGIGRRMSKVA